jgi:pimeloyl-ACP methyl ester carboxylesterase
VTNLLLERLKTGSDVILVGNSYGATIIMEAAKHFEAYSSVSPRPISTTSGHILGLIMVFPPLPFHPSSSL